MDSITLQEARAWALRHPAQLLALRAMFNDARRSGMVVSNPFKELGIERSRGRRNLPSEWLIADVDRLAQCARDVRGATGYGETIAGLLVFARAGPRASRRRRAARPHRRRRARTATRLTARPAHGSRRR